MEGGARDYAERIAVLEIQVKSLDARLGIIDAQSITNQASLNKRLQPLEDLFALFRVFGGSAGPVLRWLGPIILGLGSALIATWAASQRIPVVP